MADIESLISNLNPNDAGQVRALQQALQSQGYDVSPDGKLGGKTSAAIGKYRSDQNEIANRGLKGRELENQAQERSWQNQARQMAPWAAVPVGMGYGARKAGQIEKRQLGTQAAQLSGQIPNAPQGWGSVRRFGGRMAPYGNYGALFAAEGLGLRAVAPQIPNETAQDAARATGTGLIGASIGVTGKGMMNAMTPQGVPGAPFGAPNLPMGPGAAALPPPGPMGAGPMGGPPAAPPPSQPPLRRPSDRLVGAARAAGATGRLTKGDAADYLTKNLTAENRTAAAAELGVKSGPNFAERISNRIKLLKTSKTPLVLPLAAGAAAYSMGSDEAEAAGASPGEARIQGGKDAAAMAGGVGAGMWGMSKLPGLAKTLGRMSGPMMLNDLGTQAHQAIYGSGPRWLDVPERNPNRSQLTMQNSGPMRSAEALQIPQGIPLPQPDGSSPYPELAAPFGVPPMPMRRRRY